MGKFASINLLHINWEGFQC